MKEDKFLFLSIKFKSSVLERTGIEGGRSVMQE